MARGNGDIWLKEPRKSKKPRLIAKTEPTYLRQYLETCDLIAADHLAAFENLQAMRTGASQQLAV